MAAAKKTRTPKDVASTIKTPLSEEELARKQAAAALRKARAEEAVKSVFEVLTGPPVAVTGENVAHLFAPGGALSGTQATVSLKAVATALSKFGTTVNKSAVHLKKLVRTTTSPDPDASMQPLVRHYAAAEELSSTHGAWLACSVPLKRWYTAAELKSKTLDDFPEEDRAKIIIGLAAYRAARSKGYKPKGLVSEQMSEGVYTVTQQEDWPGKTSDAIVHVGYNKKGFPATKNTDPPSSLTPDMSLFVMRTIPTTSGRKTQSIHDALMADPIMDAISKTRAAIAAEKAEKAKRRSEKRARESDGDATHTPTGPAAKRAATLQTPDSDSSQ